MLGLGIAAGNGTSAEASRSRLGRCSIGKLHWKVKLGRGGIKNESKGGYAPLNAENSLIPRFRPPISENGKEKKKKEKGQINENCEEKSDNNQRTLRPSQFKARCHFALL